MTRPFDADLPKKHLAAAMIFRDDRGRVLLVKPTYKEPWEVPGGGVEEGESPRLACRRELREELGLDRAPGRLLCVDYRHPIPDVRADALRFLFDGGTLTTDELAAITLDRTELSEHKFVDLADLDAYVIPALARRIRSALASDVPVYLEEGDPPTDRDG